MQVANKDLFEKMDVHRAFFALVFPTIISQLIAVIYNMSDSFWIGQLNDPAQVAATAICIPAFLFTLGISNIFGIGGASLMSRCLGTSQYEKAKATCAFCVWSGVICSLVYGILFFLFDEEILRLIGASEETYHYCEQYAFWTVLCGSVPATMCGLLGHLVRAEGYAKQASFGMILGLTLNMILDPIFIFGMELEIAGAAIATVISMIVGCLYFVWFIGKRPSSSILTLRPKYWRCNDGIASEVFLVGFPSTLMNWMATLSNIVLNVLTAGYSTFAIAGMGIAKRIDAVIFAISNGIGQGVLPLIGYTYAAKNFKRMRSAIKITFLYSLAFAFLITFSLYTGAEWIMCQFIQEPQTVAYGEKFLRIICLTCPCVALTLIIMTLFQAAGKKLQPIILSIVRKGGLDIPLMFGLNAWIGVMGLAWAIPVEDVLAMLLAIGLFVPFWRKLDG